MEENEIVEKQYTPMEFAEAVYGQYKYGVWTPWGQNTNMKNLNNNQAVANYDAIVKALNDVKTNEKLLGSYSQFMQAWDTLYSKTLNYYSSMLSFDYSISCYNYRKPKELASEDFKADQRRFYKFMKRFNYKKEFNNVIMQILRTGRGFYYLRTSEGLINENTLEDSDDVKKLPKYALQLMPQDRCLITGKSNDTWLYDIDMYYFLQPQVDINLYSPIFKKKYKDVFSSNGNQKYIPHSDYGQRDGVYTLYTQNSPDDGAWCFVWDDNNANAVPPFANLMKAMFNNSQIHTIQLQKDLASAWAMVAGEIGTMDGVKSGDKPNQTKFTPEVMGAFLDVVSNSLQSIMKVMALPAENMKFYQYQDNNVNMESSALESSASQGAFGSSIIYSTGKKNATEVQNGIIADYNLMAKLYQQFNSFVEFYANKKTKKYKFAVDFKGSNFPFEREYRRKELNELFTVGLVPNTSYIASTYGIDPMQFDSMLDEMSNSGVGINNKLTMLINKNTMSSPTGEVGNPIKSDTELKDGGATARDYN